MLVRKKPDKSGVISFQIIDKLKGKYSVIKTVGSSGNAAKILDLVIEAKRLMTILSRQGVINFSMD